MIELIKNLINNLGYIVLIAFIVSRLSSFKHIIQKDNFEKGNLIILSILFGGFGILGTYIGTDVDGAIANSRIIGIMAGGILCGPFVGISSAIIAGFHRFFIDMGGITSIPCSLTTILAGIISSYIYKFTNKQNKWFYGFLGGVLVESLGMLLIIIITKPVSTALQIVKNIYIPMAFINAIGVSILILFIQNIFEEKEIIEAKQAKTTLEIANKTLPYFREINSNSLDKICTIIRDYIKCDAVAITDDKFILSHVGAGSDHHIRGKQVLTKSTKQVLKTGDLLCLKNSNQIDCPNKDCPFNSAIVAPIKDKNKIIGTLKIYYVNKDAISFKNKNLAIGLSQIISTQLELSKISKLKFLANKAEIKALQAQINPHFLFNALNTITSFVRINPDKARELIIDLSTYLRYNLENMENLVDINKEIEQVKAYVAIEKARFGDKLNFEYNIEDHINVEVPPLIIQPIIENAIKHGILEGSGKGTVKLEIRKLDDKKINIIIEDDGIGISTEIIKKIYMEKVEKNKIGLSNVHKRLKQIYGRGLDITKLEKGTKMCFTVYDLEG
ncbi:LytS/YhcK type 5TM receptor domain-containing protein [Haloimpatiens sp. FM7330]|uniref:LytS/YhcK type 5TM receptor domain-containing protein n=1 Tax=Haloimpatiens sp. FM7330 TaxID=3298610 RepID=UPI00363F0517